jgi:hypothetical protein
LGSFPRNFLTTSKSGIFNFDTPKKARIKGTAEFMDAMGIPYYHTDLFNFHNVSNQQEWAILKQKEPKHNRTHHNDPTTKEKRGRKPKLCPKELERCDRFLQDAGWDARVLTCEKNGSRTTPPSSSKKTTIPDTVEAVKATW